jgi:hypothetical protein
MKKLICCGLILLLAGCVPIGFRSSNMFVIAPAPIAGH